MKKIFILLFILAHNFGYAQTNFTSGELKCSINNNGYITAMINTHTGINYLYSDTLAPLLTVVSEGKHILPESMKSATAGKKISLQYAGGIQIDISIQSKTSHIVFTIVKAVPAAKIDAIIWGPIPTIINTTVGEVIGVVRDTDIAVGIQVLNIKTLGGDFPNSEGSTWERGIAATKKKWGSTLQAYTINRDRQRLVDAWGGNFKQMPVAPIKNETVEGSSIALFSCAAPATLDMLEKIELAEKLPHPTINGVWFKKSPLFGRSYMIASFGENEVDDMIGYAKRAGMISLYHEGPFETWGHFELGKEQFPNGRAGLKTAADKAHKAGLLFGVHMLSNFITTNDAYVSPVPDNRLSQTGHSFLMNDIDTLQKEIEVATPQYFNDTKNNSLHTVKIGTELIRYKSVTESAPYRLLDCQRGAFGTKAAAHKKNDIAAKLFDHPYNVFFPDINMQKEIAKNFANLLNETGVDHFDFDGFEGGLASGEGDYGVEQFAKEVYDNTKHPLLIGTSISKTFFWHLCSYYNWGEPWYGGFTESMQQYRIDNQGLFERNFMPHMLGWYLLSENTSMEDMEWMLARSAGYNAGFAMVASPKAIKKNAQSPALLDAIREWEYARTHHAFSTNQQEQLKDTRNVFHLEKINEGQWNLYQYALSPLFTKEKMQKQPGEPNYSTWNFIQQWDAQPLSFKIYSKGKKGFIKNIKIQLDNYTDINLPVELLAGEYLVADGSSQILLFDAKGKQKGSYTLQVALPTISSGNHTIIFDAAFSDDEPPVAEMQLKGFIKKEAVAEKK